jgi:hypothetical protein
MRDLKQFIKTTIREFLNENDIFSNKKTPEIFFRKSRNPQDDLIRNFSCYHNAYFDEYNDALKYFKTEATFSQPIAQDPITKKWCGHVESGLSGYIVRSEEEFDFAMDELTRFYPHLQDIKEISVFMSDDYYLEDGSDGEDTFKNAKYLFNIPLDISYDEYINELLIGL